MRLLIPSFGAIRTAVELIGILRLNRVIVTVEADLAEGPVKVPVREPGSPGAQIADLGAIREREVMNPPFPSVRIGKAFKHLVREHVVRGIDELAVGCPARRDGTADDIRVRLEAENHFTKVVEHKRSVKCAEDPRGRIVRGITFRRRSGGRRRQTHIDSLGQEDVVIVAETVAFNRRGRMRENRDVQDLQSVIRRYGIGGSDELGSQLVPVARKGSDVLIHDVNEVALPQIGQKTAHIAPMTGHVVYVDRMMLGGDDRGQLPRIGHVIRVEPRSR